MAKCAICGSLLKRRYEMYKVVPWDDPDNVKEFPTWLQALQYGKYNYGMRFYLLDEDGNEDW